MRARWLVPAVVVVASLGPIASHAGPCDPVLSMDYGADEAVLHFEFDTQACEVGAPIDVRARFSRESLLDGMEQAVTTTCPTTDICVVDVVLEHGPVEYAEYEGIVAYESVWDGGFVSGGVFLTRTCYAVVAVNDCVPF